MSMFVRMMGGPHIVPRVVISRLIERIIVVKLIAVLARWTIFVLGNVVLFFFFFFFFLVDLTLHRVGGVVSETSLKYFIQFSFYTALFCIFVVVVMSIYTAELRREVYTY